MMVSVSEHDVLDPQSEPRCNFQSPGAIDKHREEQIQGHSGHRPPSFKRCDSCEVDEL